MAHEAAHRLGCGTGAALEGVGHAEPVDLDEPGLVLDPEPAEEERGESDVEARPGGTPDSLVKKTDGRARAPA